MEIKELKIDRAKWTGVDRDIPCWRDDNGLLTKDGRMCCLGFLGAACGITNKTMLDKSMPDDLGARNNSKWPKAFRPDCAENTLATPDLGPMWEAASINDKHFAVKEKEKELKALFKKQGIKLTFYGSAKRKEWKNEHD